MQLDISNPRQLLSHVLLGNTEVVEKVVKTSEWKNDDLLTATVFVNGVEIPAETFEYVLNSLIGQVENRVREKYGADDLDRVVDKLANERLKVKLEDMMDRIDNAIDDFWEED